MTRPVTSPPGLEGILLTIPPVRPAGRDRAEHAAMVARQLERDAEIQALADQIRHLMTILRSCSTPGGRAAVSARIVPLVQRRDLLLGRSSRLVV
jgi:hypothetical protein